MVRVRFLTVTALSERGMTSHLWLREPLDSPKFFRIDYVGPRALIHSARVQTPDQIDDELARAICASYRVGRGNG